MKFFWVCLVFISVMGSIENGFAAEAYISISMQQAEVMIRNNSSIVLLDVRERDEFCNDYGGHIPGALNYPWDSNILSNNYGELPANRTTLVYCRSGNRSKEASAFLMENGFTAVYEIGGIKTWDGETLTCDNSPLKAAIRVLCNEN